MQAALSVPDNLWRKTVMGVQVMGVQVMRVVEVFIYLLVVILTFWIPNPCT